ncbi:MAG: sigma-E factor negative regulatory protein, partial [Lysobacteraceae bacterium]
MTTDIDGDLLEQLSAMLDGELDADRQRFLIQRMQHDGALRERWERWQLASACLKRQPLHRLPADFADRVLGNLDAPSAADLEQAGFDTAHATVDGVPAHRARHPWRWVAGLAVAASL